MAFVDSLASFLVPSFWLGFFVVVLGSFIENFGSAMCKYAHIKNMEKKIENRRYYWLDARWWFWFLTWLSGVILQLIVLPFLQLSLAIPLGAVGVSAGVLFTQWYLGEKISLRDKQGIIIIIVGSTALLLLSHKVNAFSGQITLDWLRSQLWSLDESGAIASINAPLVFLVALIVLCIALSVLYFLWLPCMNAFVAAAIPASIGGVAVIAGKATMELVATSLNADDQSGNQFARPDSWAVYVIIITMVVFHVVHTHFLQSALKSYEHPIVVSIYYTCLCWLSVAGGVLLFREWEQMDLLQSVFFCIAVLVEFAGVFIVLMGHSTPLSMYPNNADTITGPMIKVADVALDDFDDEEESVETDRKRKRKKSMRKKENVPLILRRGDEWVDQSDDTLSANHDEDDDGEDTDDDSSSSSGAAAVIRVSNGKHSSLTKSVQLAASPSTSAAASSSANNNNNNNNNTVTREVSSQSQYTSDIESGPLTSQSPSVVASELEHV